MAKKTKEIIIPLVIIKDDEKDCPYKCIFRSDDISNPECTLFKTILPSEGYYDSRSHIACDSCRELYRRYLQNEEGEE